MICQACNVFITNISDSLRCVGCKQNYHYLCLNITPSEYKENSHIYKQSWLCPGCSNITKRARKDNTPVRSQNLFDTDIEESSSSKANLGLLTNKPIMNTEEIGALLDAKLSTLRSQIAQEFKSAIADSEKSLSFLADAYEDTKKMVLDQQNTIKELSQENLNLKGADDELGSADKDTSESIPMEASDITSMSQDKTRQQKEMHQRLLQQTNNLSLL